MNLEQATAERLNQIRDLARAGITELTGTARRAGGFGEGEFVGRIGGLKPMYPELNRIPDSPGRIANAIERGSGRVYERVYYVVRNEMERQGFRPARKKSAGKLSVSPHEGRVYCRHCEQFHTKGQHRFHGQGAFHKTHLFAFNKPMKDPARVFAFLMAHARRGNLTAAGRAALTRARQQLRMQRRSIMRNPDYSIPPETFKRYVVERLGYLPAALRPDILAQLWNTQYRGQGRDVRRNRKDFEDWLQGRGMFSDGPLFGQNRRRAQRNPSGSLIYGQVLDVTAKKTQPHRCDAKCRKVHHVYRHDFTSKPELYGLPDGDVVMRSRK